MVISNLSTPKSEQKKYFEILKEEPTVEQLKINNLLCLIYYWPNNALLCSSN